MRTHRIQSLAIALLLAASAACDSATGPATRSEPSGDPQAGAGPQRKVLGTVTCYVDAVAGTTRCGEMMPAGGARATRVILTTSHFTLVSSGFYNSGTQQHTFFNQIRNDIGQNIGTHDGITVDSIRAFVTAINVTGGSGTITPSNHTGTATFTAANQKYWEYREIVAPGDASTSATWIFNVPSTVTAWNYTIGVSAPIAHPNGWIDVTGDTQIPHSGAREHTAVVRTWTGAVDNSGSVSWSSTDEGGYVYASPTDARTGYILGVRLGYATVTASKGSATPRTRTVYVY